MKFFKSIFSRQLDRLKNIQEGDEIYFIFFRLVQLVCVVSFAIGEFETILVARTYNISFQRLLALGASDALVFHYYLSLLGTILASEVTLRLLDKKRIFGFYLGILIALKATLSVYCPLGLFGLYSLLNPKAQKMFLGDAPSWIRDLLTAFKINYIEVDL